MQATHTHKSASVRTYIIVAVILTVLTILEIAYPYTTAHMVFLYPFYYPILGVLALIKFVLVVSFYMHLKYDPALLTQIFVCAMLVAVGIGVGLLFLFFVF